MSEETPLAEQFGEDVLACVDEINRMLPQLVRRFDDLVILAALAEHVGGGLCVFMRGGVCTPEQARRILAHIEATAFSQDTGMVTPEPGHG